MKTQSKTFLAALNAKELTTLTTQVAETLATGTTGKKEFTAVDLWSIQRQRKSYAIRNFS